MTTYAIGDIHGTLDALCQVIDFVCADAIKNEIVRPRVVFLGDYVDRGPNSKGVLDLLTSSCLREDIDPIFLLGNHDRALLAVLCGADPEDVFAHGGIATAQSYVPWVGNPDRGWHREFIDAVPTEHRQFLEGLTVRYRSGPWAFSHAGMHPRYDFDEQSAAFLIRGTRAFLEHEGPLPGVNRVVHGHWPTLAVEILPYRVGVDTGAGVGGLLSAVALNDDGVGVRVIAGG